MILFLIINGLMVLIILGSSDAVSTLSRYGSRGDQVVQIRRPYLKEKGYYSGNADGIFGEQDPIGSDCLSERSRSFLQMELPEKKHLLHFESEGAPPVQKIKRFKSNSLWFALQRIRSRAACPHYFCGITRRSLMKGRLPSALLFSTALHIPNFPKITFPGVIYQPGAFSCLTDGGVNAAVADSAYRAARDAIDGMDPSGGAVYYYDPDKTSNKWMHARPVIVVIGSHRFCQ